jgi:hypothetical protein
MPRFRVTEKVIITRMWDVEADTELDAPEFRQIIRPDVEEETARIIRVFRINEALNDPRGDGTGNEALPPCGDSYNVLFDNVLDAARAAGIDIDVEVARLKALHRARFAT